MSDIDHINNPQFLLNHLNIIRTRLDIITAAIHNGERELVDTLLGYLLGTLKLPLPSAYTA